MDLLKRFMMLAFFVLTLLQATSANAQSDVRTPDQKVYFPQMDPVLTGMWEGHDGLDGMKYDPQAIACMAQACAAIQATAPSNTARCNGNPDPNCRFQEVRDGRNSRYQSCYVAHRARTRQPGYARMADPPQLTSLVCSAIGALRNSSDDAIYTAVNGHARPQPAPYQPPTAKAPARQRLQPGESEMLLAQLRGLTADNKPVARSRPRTAQVHRPQAQPVASSVAYAGGISGFELLRQDDREAVLRILPGASFYTLQRSFLARDFVTESIPVMKYRRDGQAGTGNDRAQIFFPFIIRKGKIELYQPRMQLKANDYNGRLGSINAETLAFMDSCKDGSCEARFALQAGEIIRLPRKSLSDDAVSSSDKAPPVTVQPDKAPEKPDMELPEPASSASTSAVAGIPPAPTTTEPETVFADPSSTGSATPSASSSAAEPKAEGPKDSRPAADRPDIPFWVVILALVGGLVFFSAYRLHGIWKRNAPNLTVNANSINPPSIRITGQPKTLVTTGSGPAANTGIKPVVSTTIPSPGPAPDPNIQSKTGGSPPSAQKRSPLILPGAIGPTEPTIITYRGSDPQQSEPANPGDAGNAPEDPLHKKPAGDSS